MQVYLISQSILCILFLLTSNHLFASTEQPSKDTPISMCGDKAGWPPYTYEKINGDIIGASIETLQHIINNAGYKSTIELLPWTRCLSSVEQGIHSIALDATYSEERAEIYHFTKPFYTINSGLFYHQDNFPTAPVIKSQKEMADYTYCGIHGYNYSMYNIPSDSLDTLSWNEESRMRKLRQGRCDFIIGDIEILKGFATRGKIDLTDIHSIKIPEAEPKTFHMLVSKKARNSDLLKILNDGLDTLIETDGLKQLFTQYGITP